MVAEFNGTKKRLGWHGSEVPLLEVRRGVLFNLRTEPNFVVPSSYGYRVRGGVRNSMASVFLSILLQVGPSAHSVGCRASLVGPSSRSRNRKDRDRSATGMSRCIPQFCLKILRKPHGSAARYTSRRCSCLDHGKACFGGSLRFCQVGPPRRDGPHGRYGRRGSPVLHAGRLHRAHGEECDDQGSRGGLADEATCGKVLATDDGWSTPWRSSSTTPQPSSSRRSTPITASRL